MQETKIIFFKKILWLLISCCSLLGIVSFLMIEKEISHKIKIHHPGMKEDKDCRLIEKQDEAGNSITFYMDVQSVICLDGQCKIVDVRLHWDRLGGYTKYELREGVELEKKDGLPFVEVDYSKLQRILSDKKSILANFELREVVDVKKDNGGIDGISGATVLTDESASIKGAAWTCYTLWHWANGAIVDTIQNITAKTTSQTTLQTFLTKGEDRFRDFALRQFHQRKDYEPSIIDTIIIYANTFKPSSTKLALQYLKTAPKDLFYTSLQQLFLKGSEPQKILYLNALLDKNQPITQSLLNQILQYIPQLASYQSVNLVVDFLASKTITYPKINAQLLPLLNHVEFIIARRVYWYLVEQDLSAKQTRQINKFAKRHKERL